MRYVIGVDIGTTSTKAVAFTVEGEVLGTSSSPYSAYTDATGMHELDPAELFNAVITVLLEITEGRDAPAAVSFSCAMHSLILIDKFGKPMTRAMTWADTRSDAYAAKLKDSEAGHRIYQQTGTPIHAMSPLCKLLWLKDTQPEVFFQAAYFIGIKEYIWWRFFGKYQVDHSIASATGLMDIRVRQWSMDALGLAGIKARQLSALVEPTYYETEIQAPWGSLGFPPGMPFVIGGCDGCLANLGTGAIRPGDMALTIGTSGAVRMAVSKPADDPHQRVFNYVLDQGLFVSGGATNNGGNAVQWYAGLVAGETSPGELDRLAVDAEKVPAGCDGLIFLPYLLGERAPIWDAEAKGMFFGIRAIHGRPHFTRAVLEGISYGLRQIGASLEETVGPVGEIYASGGFTRNEGWLQLIADLFSKRVHVTSMADASATGAAMLAWHALGDLPSLAAAAALVKTVGTYEPDPARHAAYSSNYRVFTELYGRLKDLMKKGPAAP